MAISLIVLLTAPTSARAQPDTPPERYTLVGEWTPTPLARPPGELSAPAGLDVAPDDLIYVVDEGEGVVHELGADGTGRRTIGRPGRRVGELRAPRDVAVDAERLYVTDSGGRRVQVFDRASGRFLAVWYGVGQPWGIALGDERVYVTDVEAPQVHVLDRAGRRLATWAAADGFPFVDPRGVTVDDEGRALVADPGAGAVFVIAPDGGVAAQLRGTSSEPAFQALDVAVDGETVYAVTERVVMSFVRFPVLGRVARYAPGYHRGGQGIAVGPGAGLTVSYRDDRDVVSAVKHYTSRQAMARELLTWTSVPVALGALEGPRRVAALGDGTALLLDRWPRVQRWSTDGQPTEQQLAARGLDAAGTDEGGYLLSPDDALWLPRGELTAAQAVDLGAGVQWLAAGAGTDADTLHAVDLGAAQRWELGPEGRRAAAALDGQVVDMAAAGDRLLVADRAAGALRRIDGDGVEQARWPFPGRVTRVAAAWDGDAFFALTADGWVWKYAPDGTLRAAWDGAPDGGPVDLDVLPDGRVLVVDGLGDRVLVYARDPEGQSPVPPAPGDRCDLQPHKTAAPGEVAVGEPVTVTLTVAGSCPSESIDLDVMLVIDRSGSMEGAKLHAAKRAAVGFVSELELGRARVGVVSFSNEARLDQPLTDRQADVVRAVAGLEPGVDTVLGPAIERAAAALADDPRPGAAPTIVLLTDGRPADERAARAAAETARAAGVALFTIGLGSDVDGALLTTLAGAVDRYFEAPSAAELTGVFRRIARRLVTSMLLRTVTVTDELPERVRYVERSAVPPAAWDPTARTLRWTLTDVPAAGLRLQYQLRALASGPTNIVATATYEDGVGHRAELTFPVPEVTVRGDRRAFLPLAYQRRCPLQRADVVLVVDTSSSMQAPAERGGTKLDAARRAARGFIGQLALPGDQAAVVSFSSDATLLQPLTGDGPALLGALDALPEGRGTRIDRGLARALEAITGSSRRAANVPVVILLTDGRPIGGTEPDVRAAAEALRAAGVTVFAIGLGADADGALLVDIAGDPARYDYAPGEDDLVAIYRFIALELPCR